MVALLDGDLIRRLCTDRAVSVQDLASAIGTSPVRVMRLLNGGPADTLSLRDLERLGETLGVPGRNLLAVVNADEADSVDSEPESDGEGADDAVKLHAVMLNAGTASSEHLSRALGWDLARLRQARAALSQVLSSTGQTLVSSNGRHSLHSRRDVLSAEELERSHRIPLERKGLGVREASLLRQVARSTGDCFEVRSGYAKERAALVKMGLVRQDASGRLRLHPDVTFSLDSDAS